MTGFLHELGPSSGVYSYVSYPAAIMPNSRAKYRSESGTNYNNSPTNLMQNKRVVRGNTYAQRIPMRTLNVTSTLDDHRGEPATQGFHRKRLLPNLMNGKPQLTSGLQMGSGFRVGKTTYNIEEVPGVSVVSPSARRTASRARARKRLSSRPGENDFFAASPATMNGASEAVDGRQHRTIQTDTWLEEIKGRVQESHIGVQTDSPIHYTPPETPRQVYEPPVGVDKSTQILPDDPDLFVFHEEVVVVLEALVGKTLEQSMMEVIEEEELAAITRQKLSFRNKSLVAQHSC